MIWIQAAKIQTTRSKAIEEVINYQSPYIIGCATAEDVHVHY